MSDCTHDLTDAINMCGDGYCPMCQKDEIERLRAELAIAHRDALEAKQDVRDLLSLRSVNYKLMAERDALRGLIDQFHHAINEVGWHPGRTDDLLTSIIRSKGKEMSEMMAERDALARALHEIAEEWAGAECGEPVHAQEAYAIALAKRMYTIAVEARKP